jgi:hypothetical protein
MARLCLGSYSISRKDDCAVAGHFFLSFYVIRFGSQVRAVLKITFAPQRHLCALTLLPDSWERQYLRGFREGGSTSSPPTILKKHPCYHLRFRRFSRTNSLGAGLFVPVLFGSNLPRKPFTISAQGVVVRHLGSGPTKQRIEFRCGRAVLRCPSCRKLAQSMRAFVDTCSSTSVPERIAECFLVSGSPSAPQMNAKSPVGPACNAAVAAGW